MEATVGEEMRPLAVGGTGDNAADGVITLHPIKTDSASKHRTMNFMSVYKRNESS